MRQSFAHFRIALYAPVLAGMLLTVKARRK